jgi:hypothetical protein
VERPWLLAGGGLAQDVAGAGGYAIRGNHLYTEATLYRSEHAGSSTPISGQGSGFNISGVAPYWRAALQESLGKNYLMIGTYGINMNSFSGAVSGAKDRYVDARFDFQYQRPVRDDDEFDKLKFLHHLPGLSQLPQLRRVELVGKLG